MFSPQTLEVVAELGCERVQLLLQALHPLSQPLEVIVDVELSLRLLETVLDLADQTTQVGELVGVQLAEQSLHLFQRALHIQDIRIDF